MSPFRMEYCLILESLIFEMSFICATTFRLIGLKPSSCRLSTKFNTMAVLFWNGTQTVMVVLFWNGGSSSSDKEVK
jgi:hypothetical protein